MSDTDTQHVVSDTVPTETQNGEPGFTEAMEELEAILQRVDGDTIDIDRLADELKRATDLLELCRGKIRKAEVEVQQIVQKLGDD